MWISEVTEDLIDTITRWFLVWAKEDKGKPIEDRQPIRIYIYSYGGDLEICLHLLSMFKCSQTPVYTYALGVAYSAGAFLFMGGDRRYILPNSSVLIHQGSSGSEGTYDQVQSQNAHYKQLIQRLKDFCLSKMSISKQTFQKQWVKEWYLTTDEALNYGIATDIIDNLEEIV